MYSVQLTDSLRIECFGMFLTHPFILKYLYSVNMYK